MSNYVAYSRDEIIMENFTSKQISEYMEIAEEKEIEWAVRK